MEKRRFQTGGLEVSLVGVGCNNFGGRIDEPAAAAVVHTALDEGITHFDTAEMYGNGKSEEFLGRALGNRRDEVVIATKASPRPEGDEFRPGALARRIQEACESSLKRLGTDRIDLYYQHRPDPDAPLDEVLSTMEELVKDGKVLHVACSNYSADLLGQADQVAHDRGTTPFSANQVEWSLLNRNIEAGVAPVAQKLGVAIVPYFPLASGLLTGKYRQGEPFPPGSRLSGGGGHFARILTDENFDYVEKLTTFAESRDHTILELAFAWLAAQDGVPSIIAGATSPEQVRSNAAAASWTLTTDDLAAIPKRP
ncbi:MAG: aldo/keto reductase [Acidimicrobiales bacterium]|nr:aldo/keto reductase [Acidimicrobiales bacterium]